MKLTKEKLLGQYYSGQSIPKLLYDLLHDKESIATMIDPMCGVGDMFSPFREHKVSLNGVEIDADAYGKAHLDYPGANIKLANAFSSEAMMGYCLDGYDVVMTNPPYVRYQLVDAGKQVLNDKWMGLSGIKAALTRYARITRTITDEEKKLMMSAIDSISGLSDLAIPSWLLCMMLVRMGGQLAIVMPSSWLTREYSKSVAHLLMSMFSIDYIINDAGMSWFKGKAQVKTSLIVATRTSAVSDSHQLKYMDMFNQLADADEKLGAARNYCQKDFLVKIAGSLNYSISRLSELMGTAGSASVKPLTEFGVKFGQGLRTGGNLFFYVPNGSFVSADSHSYLRKVIQSQKDLGQTYSTSDCRCSCRLLYLQDRITSKDYAGIQFEKHRNSYQVMDKALEQYVNKAETTPINGKLIPGLSSVRTNARKETPSQQPRFWYMLPKLTKRHVGTLFVPRVNGGVPVVRRNADDYVMDANFITIWLDGSSPLNEYALLSILNSRWCSVLFEENGTVMGGGALKLDAVQMKRLFVPVFSQESLLRLSALGESLCRTSISESGEIINDIDREILKEAGVVNMDEALEALSGICAYYLNQRI